MARAVNRKTGTQFGRCRAAIARYCSIDAFTLLELLVVIAVIGILAALLLPVLNRARRSSRLAVCQNNLRQTGLALGLYVSDFTKYPYVVDDEPGSWSSLFNYKVMGPWSRLLPYCGGNSNVLMCPAAPASEPLGWLYGYNDSGTGLLGLGALDADETTPVPESLVLVPSDMLAYADGAFGWPSGFGWPGWYWPSFHGGYRFNGVFCDAHVEASRCDLLPHQPLQTVPWGYFTPDAGLTKRWNRDNQPHPETWPQTP